MKAKEIRELSVNELEKLVAEQKAKAAQVRFDIVAKQVKGHRSHRQAKKIVAQALTMLKEKSKANQA